MRQLNFGKPASDDLPALKSWVMECLNQIQAATRVPDVALEGYQPVGDYAPAAAKYIVQTADAGLSAEQALGALATGILKNTTTTGALSIAAGLSAIDALTWAANKGIRLTGTATAALVDLAAGTYTPTLTNTTNIAASTANLTRYLRLGSMVLVFGQVAMDPTAAGACLLTMSLPIASAITTLTELGGVVSNVVSDGGRIAGAAATDTAAFEWVAVDVANRNFGFIFGYEVL